MNFAKAAKTGFPIRRTGWQFWIVFNQKTQMYEWEHGESIAPDMRPEWFDVEDWEVDWPEKTITMGRYWEAVAQVMKENSSLFMGNSGSFDLQKFLHALADKLDLV